MAVRRADLAGLVQLDAGVAWPHGAGGGGRPPLKAAAQVAAFDVGKDHGALAVGEDRPVPGCSSGRSWS